MRKRAPLGAAMLLMLAGCAVGPDFERPQTRAPLPTQWTGAQAESPPDPSARFDDGGRWWEAFGDPQLDTLVVEALTRNHDLEAAAARVLEARAQLGGATSALLPTIGLSGTATRSRSGGSVAFPGLSRTGNLFQVSGIVSWEADLWGKLRRGRESAVAGLLASEQERKAAVQALVANVALTWLQVKELRGQVELNDRTVASYEENLRTVEDRYRRGVVSSLDLQLARQNLAAAEANGPSLRQQWNEARRRLELLAGRYPSGTIETRSALPDPLPPVPIGLPSDLLDRRPDLLAAEARLHAVVANVGQAKAALFPRISLTAEGGSTTNEVADLLTSPTETWSLVANLFMPLINRGATQAQIKAAEARAQQALASYRSAALGALAEVENALDQDRNLERQESLLADSVTQSRHSLDLAEDRYRRGLDNLLVTLDAQRRLNTAESQLLSVQRSRRSARIRLILALGGPWAASHPATENHEGADQ